ncbi:MAG: LPS assembly lipoprotein LptE [Candidatus Aquirickettsiella sp.]
MMTRCYPFLFSLFFSFMLTACDFQLRGHCEFSLPFYTLSLESNQPYSNFTKELQKALAAAGVHTATPSSPRLQILEQNFTRTATSLGNAGQTTTYLLVYRILFQLVDYRDHVLLAPQQIRATRSFSITSNQLAGDLNTENGLQENMQQDVIQQLLIRLGSPELRQQLRNSTCAQQQ